MVASLNLLTLYEEFDRGVLSYMLLWLRLYVTVTEVPAIFIDADTRIKGVQIGDHKIKQ